MINKQRLLIVATFSWLLILYSYADVAYPGLLSVSQQDGTTLQIQLHGDEFFNWMTTSDGFVIDTDSLHAYRYVVPQEDNWRFTNILAHNPHERSANELQFLQDFGNLVIEKLSRERKDTMQVQCERQKVVNCIPTLSSPHTGTCRVLSVLVEFPDKRFTKTRAEFNALMNQVGYHTHGSAGSVRDFYRECSNGKLDVISTVVGPIMAPKNSSNYGNSRDDLSTNPKKLILDILPQIDELIDFSQFDGNNDGFVDCIHIVFAGCGQSNNSYTCRKMIE